MWKEKLFALTVDLCFEYAKIQFIQRSSLMQTLQLTKRAVQFAEVCFLCQSQTNRSASAAVLHLDINRGATFNTRPWCLRTWRRRDRDGTSCAG